MRKLHKVLLCSTMLMSGVALNAFAPPIFMSPAIAQQRVEIRADFRTALEPYGRFERHPRFGEVWRPARLAKDWRPYTVGRWVYTDDWGWYWNAAETEDNWGWVAYHYGRWYNDDRMGWVWIAGDEWAPAWVNWRRGDARGQGRNRQSARYVGWSPLAPDEVISEVRDDPDVWVFVRARDMVAPQISTVVIRSEQRQRLIRETVIVNRTYVVRDRGPVVIVNPGIEPAFVAAVIGRPIRAYDVRPRVLIGTSNITGAIEVRGEDLRDRRRFESQRVQGRETQTEIRPAQNITAPRPLEANEQGRLGERPPRAAATDQQRREGERKEGAPGEAPRERTGEKPTATTPGAKPAEKPAATTQERRPGEPERARQGRDATQKPEDKPTATTQERKPDTERKTETERKQQGRDARQKQDDKPAAAAQERRPSEPERGRQGREPSQGEKQPAQARQPRGEDQRSPTGATPPRRENTPAAERRQQKPEGDDQPGRGRGRERGPE